MVSSMVTMLSSIAKEWRWTAGDKVPAVFDTLNFLILRQQFRYPAGRLFFEAQIFMKDTMDGPHANSMGDSKRFHAQAAILFHGGGAGGD